MDTAANPGVNRNVPEHHRFGKDGDPFTGEVMRGEIRRWKVTPKEHLGQIGRNG